MKKAKIGELRDNLSRYLEHVRGGGEVPRSLDRERPVARIVAVAAGRSADDGRLARLERRGLVRAGTGGLPVWFGRRKPLRVKGSVLRDLLTARHEGR